MNKTRHQNAERYADFYNGCMEKAGQGRQSISEKEPLPPQLHAGTTKRLKVI